MALIGLWNINFLHSSSLLILVYAQQLEQLVPYIQQLDMESNGNRLIIMGAQSTMPQDLLFGEALEIKLNIVIISCSVRVLIKLQPILFPPKNIMGN
jgi:hypothetical protein